MKKSYVYKITNPKGKIYVGSTSNIKDRKYRYKTLRVKDQVKVYNSLNKYGWENHKFEIICECDKSDKLRLEAYYGDLYKSLGPNGLNLKLPKYNDNVVSVSKETRKKIGDAHRGKKLSKEQKLLISKNSKKWLKENSHPMLGKVPWNKGIEFMSGEKNPMFGVRRSYEWKKEHSKRCRLKNKKGAEHTNSILILDTETGVFYDTIKETAFFNCVVYSSLKSRFRFNREKRFIKC